MENKYDYFGDNVPAVPVHPPAALRPDRSPNGSANSKSTGPARGSARHSHLTDLPRGTKIPERIGATAGTGSSAACLRQRGVSRTG
ncbi:hypothetical protein FQA47_009604 [Oryzias melastigma]|uniref:Uncharacterized protein n=1 Tax=Oryzias melastigma TaxID=30732 RepID=A0A834BXA3_ORYME|nr:hypothetical protein FQA47_009604 [Oryzias melastigma]